LIPFYTNHSFLKTIPEHISPHPSGHYFKFRIVIMCTFEEIEGADYLLTFFSTAQGPVIHVALIFKEKGH